MKGPTEPKHGEPKASTATPQQVKPTGATTNPTQPEHTQPPQTTSPASHEPTPEDRLVSIDEEQSHVVMTAQQTIHQGPLPHPALMHEYATVEPSLPGKIVEESLREGAHRREMEKGMLESDIRANEKAYAALERGQYFGLLAAVLTLGTGSAFAYFGYATQGAAICISVIVGLAGVFAATRGKD